MLWSCSGGRPPAPWRLYDGGAFEFERTGPSSAIRIVREETLTPEGADLSTDGASWLARGVLSITESQSLGGARVRGAQGSLRNMSHITLTLAMSDSPRRGSAIALDAPVGRGLGVWEPVRVAAGEYSWSVEIALRNPTLDRAGAPHEIALLWIESGSPGFHELQANGETRPGLLLTEGTDVLCELPDGGQWRLETGVALPPLSRSMAQLELILETDAGRPLATLVADRVEWRDVLLTLPKLDQLARLRLRCVRGEIFVGAPILVSESSGPAAQPNVLLLSLDTVRADHLDPWGGPGLTPELTSLAARGVVFERAVAQAPVTRESHQSIMTGLQVPRHAGHKRWVLPEGIPTLASHLADAGYRTAAFTDGGMVSAVFGFSRGFERYCEYASPAPVKPHLKTIFDQCTAWLEGTARRQPWLAFVHTYEAHSPYKNYEDPSSPPMFVGWHREPASLESLAERILPLGQPPRWSPEQLLRMAKQNYKSEVHYLDGALAGFLRTLEREGLLENTLVVVFSDHGEGFLEHGLMSHGNSVYEELIAVPLLLRFPGDRYAGTRVPGVVQTVDVLPTVLDLLGLAPPGETDGVSLLPACRSGRAQRRPALSADPLLFSVTLWPWKLIVPRDGNPCTLYHLEADPAETRDLLEEVQPSLLDSLVAPLTELLISAHRGFLIEIGRPDSSRSELTLAGAQIPRWRLLLVASDDEVRSAGGELLLRLSPSPLGRVVLVVPPGRLLRARDAGGEPLVLAEGAHSVGGHPLSVTRCHGEPLPESWSEQVGLPAEVVARLKALGYAQ